MIEKDKSEKEYINVLADTHNVESLKNAIDKFDNIISLGDIGSAVPKEIFKEGRLKKFRKVWRYYSKKEGDISKEDLDWFKTLNVSGWKKQIKNIKDSANDFILSFGNSDLAMISFFDECKEDISKQDSNLEIIQYPKIKSFNNIQIIFLPFQKTEPKINDILAKIDENKKLFVFAHCPAFQNAKKEYYLWNYNLLKLITENYKKEVTYIHGHMHPSESYKYSIENFPNVIFLAPKAEETLEGFGINNHIIQINTLNGNLSLIDVNSLEKRYFQNLPEEYRTNENHWNDFDDGTSN